MQAHATLEMLDTAFNIQDGDPYREIVYFPTKFQDLIAVLLSAITTSLVVLLSLIFKLYKRPLSRMVLAMSIPHVIFYGVKFVALVFPPRSDQYCRILSIINISGFESAVIWGALFAHAFYIILKHQSFNEQYLPRMMNYYLIGAVLVPLMNGGFAYLAQFLVYSETQKTCVHVIYYEHIDIPYIMTVIIPIAVAILLSIIWYKMAINKIAALRGMQAGPEAYVLLIYPGILLICWTPSLVLHISLQFGANPSDTLITIFVSLVNIQGLLDALVYGRFLKDVVRDSISSCYRKYILKEEETRSEPRSLESSEQELFASSISLLSEHNENSSVGKHL